MADETMVEYPRFCTLIVGRATPDGPCGATAVGVYQCIAWNSYRFVGSPTDVGMEVATNKPVSLCATHREAHQDWPVIAEFSALDELVGPVDVPCGHTALIDDVQHQCDIIGEHLVGVHTDGVLVWDDDGEIVDPTPVANPQVCGEAIVASDVTHTCTRGIDHDDEHYDGTLVWNEDGEHWPLGAIRPKPAPARGGGKPRR